MLMLDVSSKTKLEVVFCGLWWRVKHFLTHKFCTQNKNVNLVTFNGQENQKEFKNLFEAWVVLTVFTTSWKPVFKKSFTIHNIEPSIATWSLRPPKTPPKIERQPGSLK